MISVHKGRNIPGAWLREQCPERGIEPLVKTQSDHGGSLVDFGSDLTQSSFAPQCGQIYRSVTVELAFGFPMSPSKYLTTANKFLLPGDRNP